MPMQEETFLSKIMVQRHEDVETAKRELPLEALKARLADAPACMSFVQRLRAEQVAPRLRTLDARDAPEISSRAGCSGRR